jgi:hypothetical protein
LKYNIDRSILSIDIRPGKSLENKGKYSSHFFSNVMSLLFGKLEESHLFRFNPLSQLGQVQRLGVGENPELIIFHEQLIILPLVKRRVKRRTHDI